MRANGDFPFQSPVLLSCNTILFPFPPPSPPFPKMMNVLHLFSKSHTLTKHKKHPSSAHQASFPCHIPLSECHHTKWPFVSIVKLVWCGKMYSPRMDFVHLLFKMASSYVEMANNEYKQMKTKLWSTTMLKVYNVMQCWQYDRLHAQNSTWEGYLFSYRKKTSNGLDNQCICTGRNKAGGLIDSFSCRDSNGTKSNVKPFSREW